MWFSNFLDLEKSEIKFSLREVRIYRAGAHESWACVVDNILRHITFLNIKESMNKTSRKNSEEIFFFTLVCTAYKARILTTWFIVPNSEMSQFMLIYFGLLFWLCISCTKKKIPASLSKLFFKITNPDYLI